MASLQDAEQASHGVSRSKGNDPKSRWLVKFADSDVGGSGTGPGSGKASSQGLGGKGKGFGGLSGFGYDNGKGVGPAANKGKGKRRERDQANMPPSDNLYIKGLPPRATDAQLHRTFSQAGPVVELKILRYGDSQECAALVRMASIEAAQAAIEQLNGTTPEGSVPPLTIRYHGKVEDSAKESDNLYVKGLPLNFTQENLTELFSKCGTVRRSRILLPPTKTIGTEMQALDAAALVQMSTVEEAAQAIQTLNGTIPEGFGPVMAIRFAEARSLAAAAAPEQEPNDHLYVKGLPLGTPDFLLWALFAQFGTVVWLKVLEPRGADALDCAALVQMSTVSEAQAAVGALHGRVLAAPLQPMRVRYAGKDQQPGSNLYVAGLPLTIHEQQLRATFADCGTVTRLRLLVQPGRPETHALVQMTSPEEAEEAIKKLHGTPPQSLGPTLVVRYAKNKSGKGEKGAGKGRGEKGEKGAEKGDENLEGAEGAEVAEGAESAAEVVDEEAVAKAATEAKEAEEAAEEAALAEMASEEAALGEMTA